MGVKQIVIRSERDEKKICDLYQLDPAFYRKIISRNSSTGNARHNSSYRFPGKVPFHWELQPGKPKDSSDVKIDEPIRFPPAVHTLTFPKPCVPPTGPKAFFLANIKKIKKISSLPFGKSLSVHSFNKHMPNFNLKDAKEYCLKNIKKMETFKNIFHAKKVGKKRPEIEGKIDGDEFRFSNFDSDHFVPPFPSFGSTISSKSSMKTSWASSSTKSSFFSSTSSLNSSSLKYYAVKSSKALKIWSLQKRMAKRRVDESSKQLQENV